MFKSYLQKIFLKKKIALYFILLIFQFILYLYLGNQSSFINAYLKLFPKIRNAYVSFFKLIPFSVGDIIYILLILTILYSCYLILFKREKLLWWLQKWLIALNILYFLFTWNWGFLYSQPDLSEKINTKNITESDLKKTTDYLLKACLEERKFCSEKNGAYTVNLSKENIENQYLTASKKVSYIQPYQYTKIALKQSLFGNILNYLGVSGYFNPCTEEAQYNPTTPDSSIPFTMAHEISHQIGFAKENEANFIGYLLAVKTNDNQLQYSANFNALQYVLRDLKPLDSMYVKQIRGQFSPAMQRDYNYEKYFYNYYDGKTSELFSFLNHLFLKSHNQSGLESYNQFVELLIGYYRANGII